MSFGILTFTDDMQVYEVLLNRVPKEADVVKWQTGVPLATASSTGKEKRLHPTMPCKVHYRVCRCICILLFFAHANYACLHFPHLALFLTPQIPLFCFPMVGESVASAECGSPLLGATILHRQRLLDAIHTQRGPQPTNPPHGACTRL